jgi:pimeloyl-ACP methyl ester carboxylesterase
MGMPVVLIHGMWSTGETLRPIAERLTAAGYECVAPSLPHHEGGGDAAKVGPTSAAEYVDFLVRFIADQKFLTPPLLVGHSMGGLLAQLVGGRVPTAGLVLFAPALPPGGIAVTSVSSVRFFLPTFVKPFWWKRSHIPRSLEQSRTALFTNLLPDRQKELFESLVPESGRVLFELVLSQLDRKKACAHTYSSVKVPVAILQGGRDGVVPARGSRTLVKRYSNACLSTLTRVIGCSKNQGPTIGSSPTYSVGSMKTQNPWTLCALRGESDHG